MPITLLTCTLLVLATTLIHCKVLRLLSTRLPTMGIPARSKLVVVVLTAFMAHSSQIALYCGTLYALVRWLDAGNLAGSAGFSLAGSLYFYAETFTSLAFDGLTPTGPVRLLAGVEALNGLLLIGWSASFIYLSMERFWVDSPTITKPRV